MNQVPDLVRPRINDTLSSRRNAILGDAAAPHTLFSSFADTFMPCALPDATASFAFVGTGAEKEDPRILSRERNAAVGIKRRLALELGCGK